MTGKQMPTLLMALMLGSYALPSSAYIDCNGNSCDFYGGCRTLDITDDGVAFEFSCPSPTQSVVIVNLAINSDVPLTAKAYDLTDPSSSSPFTLRGFPDPSEVSRCFYGPSVYGRDAAYFPTNRVEIHLACSQAYCPGVAVSIRSACDPPSDSTPPSNDDDDFYQSQYPYASSSKKKAPVGAIAGGAVGGVVFLAVVALAAVLFIRHRRRATAPSPPVEVPPPRAVVEFSPQKFAEVPPPYSNQVATNVVVIETRPLGKTEFPTPYPTETPPAETAFGGFES